MKALLTQLVGLLLLGFGAWISDPAPARFVGVTETAWKTYVVAGVAVLIVGLIARAGERRADRDR